MSRRVTASLLLALAAGLPACTPPEAQRVRGGGPGADPGNRDAVVEMHGGSKMYYHTPCRTTLDECTGPLPRSGLERYNPDFESSPG